jgi:hypothetical protein
MHHFNNFYFLKKDFERRQMTNFLFQKSLKVLLAVLLIISGNAEQ